MAPYLQVGKFILKRKIGEGAFAEVRLAVHQETNEEFAVKVFDREALPKSHFERDIKKEIRIMQRLRHPNIVSIHSVLVTERKLYLVMELVRGGELYDEIVSKRRVDERTSRRYFQQIVDAMVYCHQQGVVHRDLKPENLLLDGNGNVKITDFGMSWMKDRIDPAVKAKQLLRTQCGTPKYMAPEIIVRPPGGYDGEKLDAWECGMVLYALLAGYLPFAGEDDNAVFRSILNGKLRFPQHLSPGAKDVLLLLLEKNPEKRSSLADIRTHPWFLIDYEGDGVREIEEPQEEEHRDGGDQTSRKNVPHWADEPRASKENHDPSSNHVTSDAPSVPTPITTGGKQEHNTVPFKTHVKKVESLENTNAAIPDKITSPRRSSPLAASVVNASSFSGRIRTPRGTQRRSQPGLSVLSSRNRKSGASASPRTSRHGESARTSLNAEDMKHRTGSRQKHVQPTRYHGAVQGSSRTSDGGLRDIPGPSPKAKKSLGLQHLRDEVIGGIRSPRWIPPLSKRLSSIGKIASFGKSSSATKDDDGDGSPSFRNRMRSPLANMFKSVGSGTQKEQSDCAAEQENSTWFETSPVSVNEQARRVVMSPTGGKKSRFSRDSMTSSSDEDVEPGPATDDYTESMLEPLSPPSAFRKVAEALSRKV